MHSTRVVDWCGFVVLLTLLMGVPAYAGGIRHDRPDEAYQALGQEPQFDSVVLIRPVPGGGGSGVLIAPSWVLTAAHVVEPFDVEDLVVQIGSQRVAVEERTAHERADLALLRLERPVTDTRPVRRYRGSSEERCRAVMVGYGVAGRGDETWTSIMAQAPVTAGKKRAGENTIDQIVGSDVLQADFDHPDDPSFNSMGSSEPLNLESTPLLGDSGGGLFKESEGKWVLIGITIAGVTGPMADTVGDWQENIAYGWISQWHRVSAFNEWIDAVIAGG